MRAADTKTISKSFLLKVLKALTFQEDTNKDTRTNSDRVKWEY